MVVKFVAIVDVRWNSGLGELLEGQNELADVLGLIVDCSICNTVLVPRLCLS